MDAVLVEVPYSPWSRRARQALAAEGVPFRRRTYVPLADEPWLRWRTRRWRGLISVPVLLTPEGPVADSFVIAQWASARGAGRMVPEALREPIAEVVALSELALGAGRLQATARLHADPVAVREQVPRHLRALGPLGPIVARYVAGGIVRKYRHLTEGDPSEVHAAALTQLADRLGDRPYAVGDRLSFADLAAASAVTFIAPPADAPLKPASRAAFSDPELAARFADLIARRDRVEAELSGHPAR